MLIFSKTPIGTPILLSVNGKGPVFTVGAQITTEDKAIVRTGGLVFTSSPTASIAKTFSHHDSAFYFLKTPSRGRLAAGGLKCFNQPNGNC